MLAQTRSISLHYDQMDLWEAFTAQPWGANAERWYLDNADLISTVSRYLADRLPDKRVAVIPNGVPQSFIAECAKRRRSNHGEPQYEIIYAGALWPDWIDWPLIESLVESTPDRQWCFVGAAKPPVGEDHGTDAQAILSRLRSRFNVTVMEEVEHADLAGLLVNSRMGIVPFRRTPVTLAASPIKIYDYLAAQIPALCFDTPEVCDLHNVIRCPGPPDYLQAINAVLMRPSPDHFDIDAITWQRRLRQLDAFVAQCAPLRGRA